MAFNISYRFQVQDGFSKNIKKFQTGLKKIGPVMDKMSRKMNAGFRSINRGLKASQGTLNRMSLGVIAFGALAGRSIFRFEEGMNALEAATFSTAEEMKTFRKVAAELGATTVFTADQAAFAMAALGQAGFKAEKNIKTISAVLNLASAGSISLTESANILTSVMAGFNFTAKDAVRVTDVFALAAASAKTTVGEMGFSMSKVAKIASSLGISLETTSAMLATIQNNGIRAEEAGTGLKIIINRLLKLTPDAAKGFRKMGISLKFISESISKGDLLGIFKKLNEAGLDAKKSLGVFGEEGGRVGLILSESANEIAKFDIALQGAAGSADKMANIRMKGLIGAAKRATSAFGGLLLTLGEKGGLTEGFINVSDAATSFSRTIAKLPAPVLKIGVGVGVATLAITGFGAALAAIMGPIATVFGLMAGITLSPLILTLGLASAAVLRLVTSWDELKKTFNDRGSFAAVKAFVGLDLDPAFGALDKTESLTKKLERNLAIKSIAFPKAPGFEPSTEILENRNALQKNLTSRTPATDVNLNGNINVTAGGGATVQSAEVDIGGAGGNLGLNLAGAQ